MNKKLKKALYMFGFALPIVAIPIITVACGTQTSQNTPNDAQKEADKNQNEQTPKQETPIQDENKRVVVSPSLSSSSFTKILSNDFSQLLEIKKENNSSSSFKKEDQDKAKALYKKIFESFDSSSGDMVDKINDSPYNILVTKILDLNLNVLFNIENLKTNIQNLEDSSKLENIKISDILNSNANAVFEHLRSNSNNNASNNAASDLKITTTTTNSKKIIEEAFKEKASEIYSKIHDELKKDLTQPENIKSLLEKLIFSDLFDVDKLQEKLNQ